MTAKKGKTIGRKAEGWSSRKTASVTIAFLVIVILLGLSFYILFASGPRDVHPVWKYDLASTTTNYTVSITHVTYPTPLSVYSVQVGIYENTTEVQLLVDNVNLSVMRTGSYLNGFSFTDKDNDDHLSVGDFFTFDKSIYPISSFYVILL